MIQGPRQLKLLNGDERRFSKKFQIPIHCAIDPATPFSNGQREGGPNESSKLSRYGRKMHDGDTSYIRRCCHQNYPERMAGSLACRTGKAGKSAYRGEYTSARFAYHKSELGLPKIHSTEDAQHQDSNTAVASGFNYTLSEFLGTITPAGGPHETVPHPQNGKA